MKYDFGGYATRANMRCSDGRTILPNAFADQDGAKVPLVWNHQRNDPDNVLGHAILEHRKDGVYCYCTLNSSPKARSVKALVEHGDVSALSIFANGLRERAKNVSHGTIREVSVVLAGANPGAYIDNLQIEHSDGSIEELEDQAIIYGDYTDFDFDGEVQHADDSSKPDPAKKASKDDSSDNEKGGDKTAKEIFDSLNDEQKALVYALVGQAMANAKDKDEDTDEAEQSAYDDDDDDELEHDDEGDDSMKYNVFEGGANQVQAPLLTKDDMKAIIDDAKRTGSLKHSAMDYFENMVAEGRIPGMTTDSLQHGIEELEILFPEAKSVTPTPEMIMRQQDWVPKVWNATKKTPFSRVKTVFADITQEEARARGYIKGNKKVEEQFSLLTRVTTPQTVYKLQKMDRDDVIDITDFDVIAWLKAEMRLMLNEELSRAVILGDGRVSGKPDKINESNIRPVWKDEDLYTIHAIIPKTTFEGATDNLALSDLYLDTVAEAMEQYEGSGSPVCFMSPSTLTKMKMARDKIGRRLYNTDAEVAAALGVREIIPVPLMKGDTNVREGRNDGKHQSEVDKHYRLDMLIVNLSDYTIGADKGGAVSLFDDFDIDYNKYSYLIETRCSGALTKPYSAIAVEVEVDP